MQYRMLGSTDVRCSEIGFGVWTLAAGWWGTYADEECVRLLRKSADLGITFFDTAPTYGEGRGETILAAALKDRRDEVVYSTKFGYDIEADWKSEGHQERPHRTDVDFTRRAVEASLRRLDTDRIDVLQIHNPRMTHIQQDDLWALLAELHDEGKVRAYGVSMGPAIGWREEGLAVLNSRTVHAFMMIHNLLEQDPGRAFLDAAREKNAGVMVRVPHSSGMLEGKYTKDTVFDANDHRSHRKREWLINGLAKLEKLEFLTERMTIGQAALKWVLADPQVSTVLPNIYNDQQIEEFTAAPDLPALSDEDMHRVGELYARDFDIVPA